MTHLSDQTVGSLVHLLQKVIFAGEKDGNSNSVFLNGIFVFIEETKSYMMLFRFLIAYQLHCFISVLVIMCQIANNP